MLFINSNPGHPCVTTGLREQTARALGAGRSVAAAAGESVRVALCQLDEGVMPHTGSCHRGGCAQSKTTLKMDETWGQTWSSRLQLCLKTSPSWTSLVFRCPGGCDGSVLCQLG